VSSSTQRRWKLLGEINPYGWEARQHGKAGNQRSGAEHDGCRRSSPMGQHHQEDAGYRQHERPGNRPPTADDFHDVPVEKLARNARREDERAKSEAQGDCCTLIDQRLWQQDCDQVIGGAAAQAAQNADRCPTQLARAEQRYERRQFIARRHRT